MPINQASRLRCLGPTAHVRFVLLLTMLLSVNPAPYAGEAAPAKSFEQIRQEAFQVSPDEVHTVRYRWLLRFWRAEYQVLLDVDHLESELARSEEGGADPPFDFDKIFELTRWYFQRDLVAEIRRTALSVDEQEFLILLLEHVLNGTTQKTAAAYEMNMEAEEYLEKYKPNRELASFVSRRIMVPLPPLLWTVGLSVRGALGSVEGVQGYRLIGAEIPVRYKSLVATIAWDMGWGYIPPPINGENRIFVGATFGYRIMMGKCWALLPGFGGGIVAFEQDEQRVVSPTIVGSTVLEFFWGAGRLTVGVEYRRPILGNRFAASELLVLATLPLACGSFPRGGFDSGGAVISCLPGQ